jgi:GNAT superfamily N-acetyltransferase
MTRGRLRIREITLGTDPDLRPAHRLLQASLPPGEVVALQDWRLSLAERAADLWSDQRWHLLVGLRRGRVVGMVSGSYLGSLNLGMIGYLAIHDSVRGEGLGPKLRNRLRARFERDAAQVRGRQLDALVGEVEPDNPWLRHLIRRLGAIALDLPYFQPSLHHADAPSALILYLQPLTAQRRSLPVAEVRVLLYAIWRRLYRIARPMQHREFRLMLRALTGRRRIGNRRL